ncbi:sulfatase-like hydrolase/transferase [Tamlana sp. 2201CG12-4]|uniref:sulfatase-like hydrolase/transferase n=1 Tax=Tamlana sp. 2201CG12-4 TaxID=3112582 RepID=UPI002DBC7508|nr:sulfatase-like hydrolase/transferase [Tamlana sp. 2201CG12-4]MEC3908657.1 sulfatase-like hydrolase/transferase [Tamlana sp. 2201CG12-4]
MMFLFRLNYIKLIKYICVVIALTYTKDLFSQDKPNVLMLVVDDMNNMIGDFGYTKALTPNLDKLGDRGVRLVNTHVAATYCAPSRTSIMTGIAPWVSGAYEDEPHMFNNPDHKAMPALFKKNGYNVYGGGKVYHHTAGYWDLRGFDEVFHWNNQLKSQGWPLDAWNSSNLATPSGIPISDVSVALNWENFDMTPLDNALEDDMADTQVATWAVNKLNAMGGQVLEDPFFMAVGLYAPHKPNYVPQKYFDMYPLASLPFPDFLATGATLTEKVANDHADIPASVIAAYSTRINRAAPVIADETLFKEMLQGYYAAVSYADAQLGRVLDALDASGQVDNTIVVFWSDNGYHLGEKGILAKHSLWNRTTNIPCIVAGPGFAEGVNYDGVISTLDIYPTLAAQCDLLGASVANLDGQDISNQLATPGTIDTNRRVLTVETDGVSFSVSSNQYKYVNHQPSGDEELYDGVNDLNEWVNLASNPTYTTIKNELASHIPSSPATGATAKSDLNLVISGEDFEWELTETSPLVPGNNMLITSPNNNLSINSSFDTEATNDTDDVSWNFIKVGTEDIIEFGGTATITVDVYNIQNKNTGTYLNTSSGSALEHLSPLQNTDNFKFHLEPATKVNEFYLRSLASGLTLRLENKATTTKFQFQDASKVGNKWRWILSQLNAVDTFETPIQNQANQFYVSPNNHGEAFVNGNENIDIYYWIFTEVEENIYTIENKASHQFLSDKVGEIVTANKLTIEDRFKWEVIATGETDQFYLKNIETGLYAYRNSTNANQLNLATFVDNDDFKWNFTSATLSIKAPKTENKISIYPNPSTAIINITSEIILDTYSIYSIQGKVFKEGALNKSKSSIDISALSNGIYFIKLNAASGSFIKRIIKN